MASSDKTDEQVHREMYRKSRDTIRVYNPLETEFRFKWDGITYRVYAQEEKDMERYLAEKYFHDISQFILGNIATQQGLQMLKEREEKGQIPFLDKYQENKAIWDNVTRMNNPEQLRELAKQCILGLVEEFGADEVQQYERTVDSIMEPTETNIFNDVVKSRQVATKRALPPLKKKLSEEGKV